MEAGSAHGSAQIRSTRCGLSRCATRGWAVRTRRRTGIFFSSAQFMPRCPASASSGNCQSQVSQLSKLRSAAQGLQKFDKDQEARKAFVSAARTAESDVQLRVACLMDTGRHAMERKHFLDAAHAAEKVLQILPQCRDAHMLAGQAIERMGLLDEAERHLSVVGASREIKMKCSVLEEWLQNKSSFCHLKNGPAIINNVMADLEASAVPSQRDLIEQVMMLAEMGDFEQLNKNGLFRPEWAGAHHNEIVRRVRYMALHYQVRRRLVIQNSKTFDATATEDDLSGGDYHCVLPSELGSAPQTILCADEFEQLRRSRFVIKDGVISTDLARELHEECILVRAQGPMKPGSDEKELCNPGQLACELEFHTESHRERLRQHLPALSEILNRLKSLPAALEKELGISLRVPQLLMVACYPPGSFYRKHLDSYGGRDIPRLVTILVYCNPTWTPSDGGCLRAVVDGKPVEVQPLAGRVVVFMSQEVQHEVTMSNTDRYAITLWLWDRKCDDYGR